MQTLDSKQEERQLLLRNTSEKNGKQYEKGRKIERKFKRITMTPCSSKGIEWQSRRFFFFLTKFMMNIITAMMITTTTSSSQ